MLEVPGPDETELEEKLDPDQKDAGDQVVELDEEKELELAEALEEADEIEIGGP